MTPAASPPPARDACERWSDALRDPWLLGLLAAGLLVRVAALLAVHGEAGLLGDEGRYVGGALRFHAAGDFGPDDFVRPPLYYLYLSAALLLGEHGVLVAKLGQCLAGALAALPLYRSARALGDAVVARTAAAFLLFDPTLVAYTHTLWPETLFLLVVCYVFDAVRRLRPASFFAGVRVGAAIGAAMLLKPVFGVFALLLAVWWLRRFGVAAALRLALVSGGSAALVILPAVLHNQALHGRFVLLENQGAYNFWIGNDPRPTMIVLREWRRVPGQGERARIGLERGAAAIAADPAAFARRVASNALNLWGLEFFIVRNAIMSWYGDLARGPFLALFWTIQLAHALALLAFAAGLRSAWSAPQIRLLLAWMALFTLLVSSLVVTTRFRVPFAFPIAAVAAVGATKTLRGRLQPRDGVPILLALALLALSFSRPLFREIAAGAYERASELDSLGRAFFQY